MHTTPFGKKYPKNLEQIQGAAGPGPAGYSPDKFRSTGLIFSPRATIGNAPRRLNESALVHNPGVGQYETHEALDRTKQCAARMPIGKAQIGLKTKLQMTTSPSPTSYKPSLPYMKREQNHRGSTIGNAVRMFEAMKIPTTPGPHDNQQERHSSLSTTGMGGFNKKATFRQRNVIDPIYQGTSYIPSPQQYSCALKGPEIIEGTSFNVAIIDQKVTSPMSLIGKCVLSNSKNIPAVGFAQSKRFGLTKERSPGPSDYDTDNESIGNRCRTAMGKEQSVQSKIIERFRNATPEFDEQKRRRAGRAAIFKIGQMPQTAQSKLSPRNSNRKARNPSQLYDKKIYEVDQLHTQPDDDGVKIQAPQFIVDWDSIDDLKKKSPLKQNGSDFDEKRRFPAPVRMNTVGRNIDQKSCNELCNQIIEAADYKGGRKGRVQKLHSDIDVGTTVPTTTNASSNGVNRDFTSAGSFVKASGANPAVNQSMLQKPKFQKKKTIHKKKLTLPISFFQPRQRSQSPKEIS